MKINTAVAPRLVFAACVLGWSGCALAQDRPAAGPAPEVEVRRAGTPIVVDGRLDEAAWNDAAQVTLQFPWPAQTGAKQETRARLLWDDGYLYVAYECADDDITARHTRHDDPTYEDDAVELFINPDARGTTYVGLEMNAGAVLYDYRTDHPRYLDKAFDLKGVRLASRIDGTLGVPGDRDRGWVLEVAIPLANVAGPDNGKVVAGTVWHANINRWDGTEPHRRLSMWSDSGKASPNPHGAERFGRLVFK